MPFFGHLRRGACRFLAMSGKADAVFRPCPPRGMPFFGPLAGPRCRGFRADLSAPKRPPTGRRLEALGRRHARHLIALPLSPDQRELGREGGGP